MHIRTFSRDNKGRNPALYKIREREENFSNERSISISDIVAGKAKPKAQRKIRNAKVVLFFLLWRNLRATMQLLRIPSHCLVLLVFLRIFRWYGGKAYSSVDRSIYVTTETRRVSYVPRGILKWNCRCTERENCYRYFYSFTWIWL